MKRLGIYLATVALPIMYSMPVWAEEHGGKKTLPQLDVGFYPNVLFWMITSFVLFFLVMRLWGIPGVQQTIAKRRDILDADLIAARKASEEAEGVVKAYEDGLLDARRKAHETVGGIVADAAREATVQREKQQQEMHHRMVVAQANLAEAKHEAMKETQQFVNDLVQDIVKKVMTCGIENQSAKAVKS